MPVEMKPTVPIIQTYSSDGMNTWRADPTWVLNLLGDAWVDPGHPYSHGSVPQPYSGTYSSHGPDSSLAAFLGFFNTLDMFDAVLVHRKIFAGDSNEVIAKHFGMSSDAVRKHFLHIIERAGFAGYCGGERCTARRCFASADVGPARPTIWVDDRLAFPVVADVTRGNCLKKLSAVVLAKHPDAKPWKILFSYYNVCFVSMLLDEITLWRSKPYNDPNMIWGGRFA